MIFQADERVVRELMELIHDFRRESQDSDRCIVVHTGVGGMDLFREEVTFQGTGLKRRYIGKKVPRILRRLKTPIHQSISGRYYKLYRPSSEQTNNY